MKFVGLYVGFLAGANPRPDNDSVHRCNNLREICQVWQVFPRVESRGELEQFHNCGGLE